MNLDSKYIFHFENNWLKVAQIDHEFIDHTMSFANGVLEEMRSYEYEGGTHIFKSNEHFKRLISAAQKKNIKIDISLDKLIRLSYQLLEKNNLKNATLQALIYSQNDEPKFMLSAKKTTPFTVKEHLEINTDSKDSEKEGLTEILAINGSGDIIFNSTNSFFFVKDGVLYTPGMEKDSTPGIMRDAIIECAMVLGYPVIEKSISIEEVDGSEAVFFSSYSNPMSLVDKINSYTVTKDWKDTIAMDLLMMFRQQATNEGFWNHSII